MSLPSELRDELSARFGSIASVREIVGGSISSALRVELAGRTCFLKHLRDAPDGFFAAERAGLDALREASGGAIRVPMVVDCNDAPSGWSWILLEWLEERRAADSDRRSLGAGLAELHRRGTQGWGWNRDGFIGRLPQSNTRRQTWAEFWWRERLQPQLAQARRTGGIGSPAEWERLRAVLPGVLGPAEDEGASLLHGDLWSGNVVYTSAGPALVDPACYQGHREVDLAMAELFGGFADAFFAEYEATWPLSAGYEVRRRVYQLYYLLVHVNLFGSSYAARTVATLRSVLDAVRA